MEIEFEKMRHWKTTTVPVIEGALGMSKKVSYKHIDKIPCSPRLRKYKLSHFSEVLIF